MDNVGVDAEVWAALMSAVSNWRERYPSTPQLSRFEHRMDNDPGFRQHIQKEVVLDATFRRHRDLAVYRCLKAILFANGATFDDPVETGDYHPRQAARVQKRAQDAGILEAAGRARGDQRSKKWRTPFRPSDDGLELAMWKDMRAGGLERDYGPVLGEVSTIQRLLYGHSAIQHIHIMHGDTNLAYLWAFIRGEARMFQHEFAEDESHARVLFRQWMTHLEHRRGIHKERWASLDRYAAKPAYVEGIFHNVTHMMLAEWFNRQSHQDQEDWLRVSTTYRVSREEVRAAFELRSRAPCWKGTAYLTVESIAALHQLGQHDAAEELAAIAAEAAEEELERGLYTFRRGQIARDLSDCASAARHHSDAADHFRAADAPLYEAVALCEWAESAVQTTGEQPATALAKSIAVGATLVPPSHRFVFQYHLASAYRRLDQPKHELDALIEALKIDALGAGDTALLIQIDRRIELLQERSYATRR